MRLLADENMPLSLIEGLRSRGHDVAWALEIMRGAPDPDILDRACRENRLLLTQDKGFSELAFRRRLPSPCGIVLFRLGLCEPDAALARMLEAFNSREDWAGNLSVVTRRAIRVRPLPPPA